MKPQLKTLIVFCFLMCVHLRLSAADYSDFSHATKKHQASCSTCHKITFPDIKDYPNHDACVSCRRPQFFRGARPPICSVCHTKTSPRDEARLPFRNPAATRQFAIEFPHDRHHLRCQLALSLARMLMWGLGSFESRASVVAEN